MSTTYEYHSGAELLVACESSEADEAMRLLSIELRRPVSVRAQAIAAVTSTTHTHTEGENVIATQQTCPSNR